MSLAVIGRRYARALFDIAWGQKAVAQFQDELARVEQAGRVLPDLFTMLAWEEVAPKKRHAVVDDLAGPLQLSPMVVNFLKVLIDKRRVFAFAEIVEAYEALAADAASIVTATVTTAAPLMDATILTEIESAIGKLKQKQVRVIPHVDPDLIGGVMIRVGDEVFDGSIAAELERMREQLLSV